MRRALTMFMLTTAALAAAVVFFAIFTGPRAAIDLGDPRSDTTLLGGYHVHSTASDGTGTREDIARAAAAAGIQFIVLTDHGDGTRAPAPPAYLHGVLCIDAVEVNTFSGHLVALSIAGASPFPLAGEARDVIEDIHRLGGVAIAAHPDSPDETLRWRGAARYDGLEWINADTEWRDDSLRDLAFAAARSLRRGPESVASLFSRPAFTLQRWDAALRTRPVVGLAALDAHARFGFDGEPRGRAVLRWPSYRNMFRTMAQAVVLDRPLTGEPGGDAAAVLASLSGGRTFSIVTALATAPPIEFVAEQQGRRAFVGQRIDPFDPAQPARIVARIPAAPGARLTLVRSGQIVAEGQGSLTVTRAIEPGAYRLEATLPHGAVPWIVTSPLYLGGEEPPEPSPPAPDAAAYLSLDDLSAWAVEHDPSSRAAWSAEAPDVRLDFTLGAGVPAGQFAALATRAVGDAGLSQVEFVARSSRPMRLSVQVRLPGGAEAQRWRRSVYVDETPRSFVVTLEDMEPVGGSTSLRPITARVQAILFVVDTLNTALGTAGTFWLREVRAGVGVGGASADAPAPDVRSAR